MLRRRFLALFVLVVLLLAGVPAVAKSDHQRYLALGDSVAFGFDPLVFDRSEANNFVGYPEALAGLLDIDEANASCPGEASEGFISLSGDDNGCRAYRAAFPLHVSYTQSQLDFAIAFLKDPRHQHTRLVTLNIGANDLFLLQKRCNGVTACIFNGLPGLLATLGRNLSIIYGRIRSDAGYRGQLVALTYYALDYNDVAGVQIVQAINEVIAETTRAAAGQVADGFQAFRKASASAAGDPCKAGLLIRFSTMPLRCDIHPSPVGRDVLADTIFALIAVPDDD